MVDELPTGLLPGSQFWRKVDGENVPCSRSQPTVTGQQDGKRYATGEVIEWQEKAVEKEWTGWLVGPRRRRALWQHHIRWLALAC
jgi:hypothetical protein